MKQNFKRSLDELAAIVAATASFFEREGVDPRARNAVDLCVEELFVNMVKYNNTSKHDIQIEMSPHARGVEVRMTERDVDRFDPRDVPTPDVNADLDERTPGGLGVFLVMKMVESIHYEYRDRTSIITFVTGAK